MVAVPVSALGGSVVTDNPALAADASVSAVSAMRLKNVYVVFADKPVNTLFCCQAPLFIRYSFPENAVSVTLLCVLDTSAGAAGAEGAALFKTAAVAALVRVPVSTLEVISSVMVLPKSAVATV